MLRHLAHDIYAFPGELRLSWPWLGVIATAAGTVLVDSGTGPVQAAALQAELDRIGARPVTHILLTHHHWDHVFGSIAFPGAEIIAHEETQKHLLVMESEPWSREYVESKAESFPRGRAVTALINQAVPEWEGFAVRPATRTFRSWHELELGGYRFFIEHVGGQHEPDQCTVLVEPGNVLFVGDATYGRGPKATWDRRALAAAAQHFLDSGAEWIVEGHRAPSTAAAFAERFEDKDEG